MVDEERKRRSGVMSRHTLSEEQGKLRVSSDVTANQRSGQLKQLTAILERYGAANESGATRAGLAGSHEERAETTEVPEEHLKDFWKAEIWAYFEDELWNMYLDESDKCASTNEVIECELRGIALRTGPAEPGGVFERNLKGGVLAGTYEERAAVATTSSRNVFERDLKGITWRTNAATVGGVLAGSYEERAAVSTMSPRKVLQRDFKGIARRTNAATVGGVLVGSYEERAETTEVLEHDLKGGVLAGTYEERAAVATTSSRNVFERDLKGITWRTNAATVGGVLAGSYEERAAVSTMSPHKVLQRDFKGIARRTSPTELGVFLAGMYEERAAASTTSPNRVFERDLKGVSRRTSSATLGGVLVGTHEERAAAGTTCSSNVLECDLKGTVSRMSPARGTRGYSGCGNLLRASPLIRSCNLPSSTNIWGVQNEAREAEPSKPAPDKKARARASTAAYYQKKLKKAVQDRERRQKYAKAKGTSVAAPQAQFNGLNGSEQEVSEMLAAMQEQRRRHLEHLPPAQSDSVLCRDAHYPADEQSDKDHCSASEAEMLPPSDEEEDSDEEPGAR
ncbi:hypothetical protein B0H11DRAFT_1920277 [Mycena galericulata]|nr:hypothetical protein B0H11DRAFT_1920277 [Mycena galericulata]